MSSSKNNFVFNEDELNGLDYQMIKEDKLEATIKLFKLNTEEYPESANAYDSLAKAYMKNGQKDKAIENYKKSLELNPDNENAKEKLDRLKN